MILRASAEHMGADAQCVRRLRLVILGSRTLRTMPHCSKKPPARYGWFCGRGAGWGWQHTTEAGIACRSHERREGVVREVEKAATIAPEAQNCPVAPRLPWRWYSFLAQQKR